MLFTRSEAARFFARSVADYQSASRVRHLAAFRGALGSVTSWTQVEQRTLTTSRLQLANDAIEG